MDKLILDACCGGKQFWFDKNHGNVLYIDIRDEDKGRLPIIPNFEVKPDAIMDFRDLSAIQDRTFKLIVWDPPHIRELGKTSIMRKKYGSLEAETWRHDLKKGFNELWRVLDNHGTLVFKWSEADVKVDEVLALFHENPLFGHPTSKHGKTKWMVFFKNEPNPPHQALSEAKGDSQQVDRVEGEGDD